MAIDQTDKSLSFAVGDSVTFEFDTNGLQSFGLSLRMSSRETDFVDGGLEVVFSAKVDFHTLNGSEREICSELVADVKAGITSEDSSERLGYCYVHALHRGGKLIDVNLELDRDRVRDIADHLRRAPCSRCKIAGTVTRVATASLPSLIDVSEFALSTPA